MAGLVALSSCIAEGYSDRDLDAACARGCNPKGSARLTTGITTDSPALRIGPGVGEVTIPLPLSTPPPQILARGEGSFEYCFGMDECEDDTDVHSMPAPYVFAWRDLYGRHTYGGVVVIRIARPDSWIDIVDVRWVR